MSDSAAAKILHLHGDDNVCVATQELFSGTRVDPGHETVTLLESIPMGHKIAVYVIRHGDPIIKYGQQIGVATRDIPPGAWVHSHNLANEDAALDYAPASAVPPPPAVIEGRTFDGYRRADGRAGTRNYLALITTVNCSASVAKYVARRFTPDVLKDYPHVDGVVAFTHEAGCGMPYGGQTHEMLNRVLGGVARHPNIGGYLLIGLGCEQATPDFLVQQQRLVQIGGIDGDGSGPVVLTLQDSGGTLKTVEAAARRVADLLPRVNDVRRESLPASELVVGLECGGSDGNSGITANPALGVASDLLVACGGTAVLSETPEICGAEHLLTRRAVSREVADRLMARVEWWKWYTSVFGARLDNNPSPGNKEGGLTTIAEKSLGAVAKAGSTALREVYEYAQQMTTRGLVFMDTPGYDPPSVTGMVAGGANVVVFTTGRGSCFGCKPTPSLKVATNTPMYQRMLDDMDLNAGGILENRSVDDVGHEIFEEILEVASGKPTKSERHGIGDEEFVPWTIGPVL